MRGLDDDGAHLAHTRLEARLLEQPHHLDHLVHHVDGVIHRLDQVLDVATLKRGDEALAHGEQHLAGDHVGLVLELDDLTAMALDALAAIEQLLQRLGAGDQDAGMAKRSKNLSSRGNSARNQLSMFYPVAFRNEPVQVL